MAYLAEQIVQTTNVQSIPVVETRKSLRRPTLSTKKQAVTAVIRLKICRTYFGVSLTPYPALEDMTYAVDKILSQSIGITNFVQDLKKVRSCKEDSKEKLTLLM